MTVFIISLLSASLIMSVITLLLLLFFKKKPQLLSAKTRYTIWVLVLLALVIPIRPSFGTGLVQFTSPMMPEIVTNHPVAQTATQVAQANVSTLTSITPRQMVTYLFVASLLIWGVGVAITFTRHIWQYYRFRQMVLRWGCDETDDNVLNSLSTILDRYGVAHDRIKIKRCSLIKSPMLIGFIRPMILLPTAPLSDTAVSMILEHEVIHYVHKDVWINLLGIIAMSLHWFNPLVKLCCSAMQEEGEAFCDATLLAGRSITYRRSYGEMIIQSLSRGLSEPIALSTCFYGKKFNFKKRILSIMDTSDKLKRFSFIVITSVLSFIVLSGSIVVLVQPSVRETAQQVAVNVIEEIPVKTAVAKEVDDISLPTEEEIQAIKATIKSNKTATNTNSSSPASSTSRQTTTTPSNNSASTATASAANATTTTTNATSTNSNTTYQSVATAVDTDDIDDVDDADDDDDDAYDDED